MKSIKSQILLKVLLLSQQVVQLLSVELNHSFLQLTLQLAEHISAHTFLNQQCYPGGKCGGLICIGLIFYIFL